MALSDTISEFQQVRLLGKGKIARLLQKLAPEDAKLLTAYLGKSNDELPAHLLTKALWREYGPDCVDPDSVSKYRLRTQRTVNGL